jgi:hypothetical protein
MVAPARVRGDPSPAAAAVLTLASNKTVFDP